MDATQLFLLKNKIVSLIGAIQEPETLEEPLDWEEVSTTLIEVDLFLTNLLPTAELTPPVYLDFNGNKLAPDDRVLVAASLPKPTLLLGKVTKLLPKVVEILVTQLSRPEEYPGQINQTILIRQSSNIFKLEPL